jgi:hypothetical protein
MTLYNQIQQLILQCLDRKISVKSFREQFVPLFFSINRRYDIDATSLADNVDNLYGDLLIGDLTEEQFRQKLVQLRPIFTESDNDADCNIWPSFQTQFSATTLNNVTEEPEMDQTSAGNVQQLLSEVESLGSK